MKSPNYEIGQHYTDAAVSEALIAHLSLAEPTHIIDLGVGQGSLLAAASKRWSQAKLIGVDVDPANVAWAAAKLPGSKMHCGDGLLPDVLTLLGLPPSSVDLALCNPPFIRGSSITHELAAEIGLTDQTSIRGDEAELAFLARNLQHLKPGGVLGIILPNCYVAGQRYMPLRQALFTSLCIEAAVQLPRRAFITADVETHFVVIRKGGASTKVRLHGLNAQGVLTPEIVVSRNAAVERFDFDFHAAGRLDHSKTLAEIGVDLRRGSYSMARARAKDVTVFHTTHFKNYPDGQVHWPFEDDNQGLRAAPGDILIPRVGSRCLQHCARVASGSPLLSDCVYRVRPPVECSGQVFDFLRSIEGRQARSRAAYGSCAKVLSKHSLLNLFVPYIDHADTQLPGDNLCGLSADNKRRNMV